LEKNFFDENGEKIDCMVQKKSNTSDYTVSTIIPMYNAEAFIREAIESILIQTYPVSEIIVVDDGSTDKCADIVREYKNITLLSKAHTGIYETMNYGLQNVTGDFITFLDADDRWLPGKISKQLDILLNNTGYDMVFGYAERFQMIMTDNKLYERAIDILPGTSVQGGIFTKKIFDTVGKFTVDTNKHGFIDWYARAVEMGFKMIIDNTVVFQRRIHHSNEGIINKEQQKKSYFNAIKAALDRRRSN